jgi:hypothetical protein
MYTLTHAKLVAGSKSIDDCRCARHFYKDTTTPVTNDTCKLSGGNVINPCMACPANSETGAWPGMYTTYHRAIQMCGMA